MNHHAEGDSGLFTVTEAGRLALDKDATQKAEGA